MHSLAVPSLAVGRLSHTHLQGDTRARSHERAHIHERGCKREHTSTNETSVRHTRAHTHGHARKQAPTHAQRIDHGCPSPWPTLCAWGVAGDMVGLAACGADRLARGMTTPEFFKSNSGAKGQSSSPWQWNLKLADFVAVVEQHSGALAVLAPQRPDDHPAPLRRPEPDLATGQVHVTRPPTAALAG